MDIWDQVDKLLSELKAADLDRRTGQEMGKAILLRVATLDYLDLVREQDWDGARGQLDCILVAVVNMISCLPEGSVGGQEPGTPS